MNRDEIIVKLAPCGIDCYRCAFFKDGPVAEAGRSLKSGLE